MNGKPHFVILQYDEFIRFVIAVSGEKRQTSFRSWITTASMSSSYCRPIITNHYRCVGTINIWVRSTKRTTWASTTTSKSPSTRWTAQRHAALPDARLLRASGGAVSGVRCMQMDGFLDELQRVREETMEAIQANKDIVRRRRLVRAPRYVEHPLGNHQGVQFPLLAPRLYQRPQISQNSVQGTSCCRLQGPIACFGRPGYQITL